MVEKAEGLELEFDSPFPERYRPCFNSLLRDSMTESVFKNGAVRKLLTV